MSKIKSNVKWTKVDPAKLPANQKAAWDKIEATRKAYRETKEYQAFMAATKAFTDMVKADFAKVLPAGKVAEIATKYGVAVRVVDGATSNVQSLTEILNAIKLAA